MAIDWSGIIKAAAPAAIGVAGQVAAGRQAGRQAQATAQVPVDQLNQRAYETDISSKKSGLDAADAAMLARALGMLQENAAARKAPGERAANSVRGDVLANAQDSTFSGRSRIPKVEFGGGLRPSMFSENTRKLGGEMSRQALVDQLKGESTPFSDMPAADYSSVINAPGAPKGTALPEGGRLDSVLQAIGQYGGLASGVAGALAGSQGPAGVPSVGQAAPVNTMPGTLMPTPAPPPVAAPMLAGRTIGNGMTIPRSY